MLRYICMRMRTTPWTDWCMCMHHTIPVSQETGTSTGSGVTMGTTGYLGGGVTTNGLTGADTPGEREEDGAVSPAKRAGCGLDIGIRAMQTEIWLHMLQLRVGKYKQLPPSSLTLPFALFSSLTSSFIEVETCSSASLSEVSSDSVVVHDSSSLPSSSLVLVGSGQVIPIRDMNSRRDGSRGRCGRLASLFFVKLNKRFNCHPCVS